MTTLTTPTASDDRSASLPIAAAVVGILAALGAAAVVALAAARPRHPHPWWDVGVAAAALIGLGVAHRAKLSVLGRDAKGMGWARAGAWLSGIAVTAGIVALLATWPVPLGGSIETSIDWLYARVSNTTLTTANQLKLAANWLTWLLLLGGMKASAWSWLMIPAIALLALAVTRHWGITIFTLLSLGLVWNMGYWTGTMETLSLVLLSTIAAIIIGVPVGILASLWAWLEGIVKPILDFMQTLPAFVYLIPAVPFFGTGSAAAIITIVIFSIPPTIRLTILGIHQAPEELVEAADAFGSTTMQKMVKLQLPLAIETIRAGINQTIMLALSMAVIAALIGANGLGAAVWSAINTAEVGDGFESGIAIVILAIVLDRIMQHVGGTQAPSERG